ncbi:zf-HC2 domain-containing protein [Actinomadura graeca]|uniref:Zf-HC2 domain-containing protein n=1 Tax=Actinomadura graeca TaxID=2750812 RepID=A0ABX8R2Z4_9ACTN|nr:zf-HC2 domain-containing protein [Actinomadura graeca]QXJ24639.1 zf-HC2 domain-containing protein [Actinomadura graeca]
MSSQVEHTDVGAYALGLLEEADRRAFEAHLAECGSCSGELRQMAGMAEALSGIGPFLESADRAADEPPAGPGRHGGASGASAGPPGTVPSISPPAPGEEDPSAPAAPVIDMLRQKRRAERRFRRGTYIIGTAAAAALLATGVTIGASLDDGAAPSDQHSGHGPAQALVIWGERHRASNAATGASGVVGLESKGWGTHVGLELRGVKGPLKCHLEAVSRSGERSVVTGWQVPVKGYGVPGSPAPLITHGGTGIVRGDLSRFEVVVDNGGPVLLTIPL